MRPILWGTIWFVIGLVGWLAFSVIIGFGEGLGGEAPPLLNAFLYIFGTIFFFSLPISIIAEIIRWIKRRRKKNL
jgi:hypothetical protein